MSDCVITGEGQLDAQSLHGKVPIQVAQLAKKYHKKVIGLFGESLIDDIPQWFDKTHTIVPQIASQEIALKEPFKTFKQLLKTVEL
jgi:glycerate kinase